MATAAEVEHWLQEFVKGFNFERPGKDRSLGLDIANVVIRGPHLDGFGGIMGRAAEHKDWEGNEWPPNSTREPPKSGYKGWKERKYGWADEPNRRTNQMLSALSLGAKTTVAKDLVEIRPGLDQPPSDSRSPTGFINKQDKKVTDTQKMQFAHVSSKNRPARPFYGVNDEDARNVSEAAQEALNEYLSGF
jgi:hypothetical protein